MTARAYDIMRELPAIFANVSGLEAADVEIGYRKLTSIPEGDLPRVLVYNPSTDEPEPPVFGLRAVEFGFTILIVNLIDTDEATLALSESMAIVLKAASLTNADTAFMNPGSIITDDKRQRAIVGAFMSALWEGV